MCIKCPNAFSGRLLWAWQNLKCSQEVHLRCIHFSSVLPLVSWIVTVNFLRDLQQPCHTLTAPRLIKNLSEREREALDFYMSLLQLWKDLGIVILSADSLSVLLFCSSPSSTVITISLVLRNMFLCFKYGIETFILLQYLSEQNLTDCRLRWEVRVLKGASDERNIWINWSFEHNLKCLLLIQQHVQTASLFQFSSVNLVRADVHSNSNKEDFE